MTVASSVAAHVCSLFSFVFFSLISLNMNIMEMFLFFCEYYIFLFENKNVVMLIFHLHTPHEALSLSCWDSNKI